jgi:hypothetical protein
VIGDREPNLFELPTVICYCVPQGPSKCAACRQRAWRKDIVATYVNALSAPPPLNYVPPLPPAAPGPPWAPPPAPPGASHPSHGFVAGDMCPQCGNDYLIPHPVSNRLMCSVCRWGVGDVINRGIP